MAARAPAIDPIHRVSHSLTLSAHSGAILMPMITIQVTREGSAPGRSAVTAEEKAALIQGASQLLLDVLHKPLDSTFVVIEEVELENWGWGGLPVPELRKRRARGAT
jgi:4-oxalocrotonate tautomerase